MENKLATVMQIIVVVIGAKFQTVIAVILLLN